MSHFVEAQSVLSSGPENVALGWLYAGMAYGAIHSNRTKEGTLWSKKAMDLAERFGHERLWNWSALEQSVFLFFAGHLAEALELLDRAYDKASQQEGYVGDSRDITWNAGSFRSILADPLEARGLFLRELAKSGIAQDNIHRRQMLSLLRSSYIESGDLSKALEIPDDEQRDFSGSRAAGGFLALYQGDWERADQIFSKKLELAHKSGSDDQAVAAMEWAGWVRHIRGEFAEAEVSERLGLELLCAYDENSNLPDQLWYRTRLAILYADMDRTREAQPHLARCQEIVGNGEDWRGLAGAVARAVAVVAAAEERYQDAEKQFEKAVEIFRRYHVPFEEAEAFYYWARALNKSGERERANDKLDAAVEIYRRCGAGERWVERVGAVRAPAFRSPAPAQNEGVLRREGDYGTIVPVSSGSASAGPDRRAIASVLFTDVVASTESVAQLKDRHWADLLVRLHQALHSRVAEFGGRLVDTSGDGMLAVFNHPAEAIRCAFAIIESSSQLGLRIRSGVHTGECEFVGSHVAGIAVHIGARVAAQAGPNEVMVSSTVRDLLVGGEITFVDRRVNALKGIPGEWRLYAVEQQG